jgi:hypothetical protein
VHLRFPLPFNICSSSIAFPFSVFVFIALCRITLYMHAASCYALRHQNIWLREWGRWCLVHVPLGCSL